MDLNMLQGFDFELFAKPGEAHLLSKTRVKKTKLEYK